MKIGIVDSILDAPNQIKDYCDIGENRDYTGKKVRDDMGHGTDVFSILYSLCPNATFSFYRIFNESVDADPGDILQPIQDAIDDNIDFLNISGGYSSAPASPDRLVSRAVRDATENGTCIVAASGNLEGDPDEAVNYPAMVEETIAVGGYSPICTAPHGSKEEILEYERSHDHVSRYWVDTSGIPDSGPNQLDGVFCGQTGCSNSDSCSDYRCEQSWPGNVQRRGAKPDVLAPTHILNKEMTGIYNFIRGTSYSCPLIAGLLATIYAAVTPDKTPSPSEIRQAVLDSRTMLDDGSGEKFDYNGTIQRLA